MNRREFITALGVVGAAGQAGSPGTARPAGRRDGPRRLAAPATTEPILEPDLPIVDPHHHLWERPGLALSARRLLADTQQRAQHRRHRIRPVPLDVSRRRPGEMRPVGETEFVNGVAAMSASGIYGPTRACAGIVGHADLTLGERVEPVLEAHLAPAAGASAASATSPPGTPIRVCTIPTTHRRPACLADTTFRAGFACSAARPSSTLVYHPQIDELADLAGLSRTCRSCSTHRRRPARDRRLRRAAEEVFAAGRRRSARSRPARTCA